MDATVELVCSSPYRLNRSVRRGSLMKEDAPKSWDNLLSSLHTLDIEGVSPSNIIRKESGFDAALSEELKKSGNLEDPVVETLQHDSTQLVLLVEETLLQLREAGVDLKLKSPEELKLLGKSIQSTGGKRSETEENLMTLLQHLQALLTITSAKYKESVKELEVVKIAIDDHLTSAGYGQYNSEHTILENLKLIMSDSAKKSKLRRTMTTTKTLRSLRNLQDKLERTQEDVKNKENFESDLKITLDQLKYEHMLLQRQYEEERINYKQVLADYQQSCDSLRSELNTVTTALDSMTRQAVESENDRNEYKTRYDQLSEKYEELKTKLEVDKVDSLGISPSISFNSPSLFNSRDSLIAAPQARPFANGANSPGRSFSPINSDIVNSALSGSHSPQASSGSAVSSSILRHEFRKYVVELQNNFKEDLAKERNERSRLEGQLSRYRNEVLHREAGGENSESGS